tara:strand:+ start:289 stop:402 length:114 start_codon:yes stop_codon:yes gene_type:complete
MFLGTDIDYLVLGNFIIDKVNLKTSMLLNYKNKYELD